MSKEVVTEPQNGRATSMLLRNSCTAPDDVDEERLKLEFLVGDLNKALEQNANLRTIDMPTAVLLSAVEKAYYRVRRIQAWQKQQYMKEKNGVLHRGS